MATLAWPLWMDMPLVVYELRNFCITVPTVAAKSVVVEVVVVVVATVN